ncbi:MAG: MraY family glycosyltransferase [Peptococcaceae bacterium]|nr:MraY family glycosyltransferase [Peptococcaceae bacterium]
MYIDFLKYAITGLLFTLILTPGAMIVARKVGAIDYPSERRVHSKPTPRLGGIALYTSFVVTVCLFFKLDAQIKGLFIGSTLILAVGIYDDIKGVRPIVKLLGQVCAALILLRFGYQMTGLNLPLIGWKYFAAWGSVWGMLWGGLFVVIWVVSLVNTVNITDGLDGLAAGICVEACLVLLWSAVQIHQVQAAGLMAVLTGICLGFLFFNFNPAKVFMGDSGSMFLGFVIAGVSVNGFLKTPVLFGLVLPLLALGMPIFDMTFAVVRRKWRGQPIALADRGHLHHRLLDAGFTQREAVLVLYLLSAILGCAALFASREEWQWAVLLTLLVAAIVTGLFMFKSHKAILRRSGSK